ncbi:hypothetical protein [Pedobacter sp. UYEF25]
MLIGITAKSKQAIRDTEALLSADLGSTTQKLFQEKIDQSTIYKMNGHTSHMENSCAVAE